MTTTINLMPTPQGRKVHAYLTRKHLIPSDATVNAILTLEDALTLTDETERKRYAGLAIQHQHDKTTVLDGKLDASLHAPVVKPYKHNQKIELGSDTEGRRIKNHADPIANDVELYAEAMGISESDAWSRRRTQIDACNGHAVYLTKPAPQPEPMPEPIPISRATRPRTTPQPAHMDAESFARSIGRTVTQKGRNLWVDFDAKPDQPTRDRLKSYGFRWAQKRQAWWLDTTRTSTTINDMAAG